MKRRSFLKSVAAAIISVFMARALGAEEVKPGDKAHQQGKELTEEEFCRDPYSPMRGTYENEKFKAVSQYVWSGRYAAPNPAWFNATHEIAFAKDGRKTPIVVEVIDRTIHPHEISEVSKAPIGAYATVFSMTMEPSEIQPDFTPLYKGLRPKI